MYGRIFVFYCTLVFAIITGIGDSKRVSFNHRFSLVSGIGAAILFAANAMCSTPFSQYGMIQNVQSYSSNPFYNANSATISAPKIVYASGPALKAGDCERVIMALVENECASLNRCQSTKLADIRPNLMVKLSALPGYNYASSCAGYIDTIFDNYVKNAKTNTIVQPYAVFSGTTTTNTTVLQTPQTNQNVPAWKAEYNERAAELKALQAQTKTTPDTFIQTDFPKTFDDLSFEERNNIKSQGYEPYKDAQVYTSLNIVPEEKEENSNTGTTTTPSQYASVYKCIQKYGDVETQATDNLYNTGTSSTEFANAQANLTTAVTNAILSPCYCTQGNSQQTTLLDAMKVTCDTTFANKAKADAVAFVTGVVASLR